MSRVPELLYHHQMSCGFRATIVLSLSATQCLFLSPTDTKMFRNPATKISVATGDNSLADDHFHQKQGAGYESSVTTYA